MLASAVCVLLLAGDVKPGTPQDAAVPSKPGTRIELVTVTGAKFTGYVEGPTQSRLFQDGAMVDPRKLPGAEKIELHAVNGLNGKMAMPFKNIASWKIADRGEGAPAKGERKASDDRHRALLQEEEARLEALRVQRELKRQETINRKAEEEARKALEEQAEKMLAAERLLARFPPELGWGPEKRADLLRRKIVVKVFPSAEEQEFLDSFDAWCQALDLRQQREAKLKKQLELTGKIEGRKDDAPKQEAEPKREP